METYIYLFIVVLGAYLIKSLTGFGNTLIINSLFSIVKENRFITPVDLLLGLPANIYMAWKDRKSINFKIVVPLSIMVLIGNIPGVLLLDIGGDRLLKSVMGLVLVLLAIEIFTRKSSAAGAETTSSQDLRLKSAGLKDSNSKNSFAIYAVGLISGVLMGLFGIGALLAAFIGRQTDSRSNYRGNLCFVFIVDNIFRVVMYGINGLINRNILLISLGLAPAVLIGMLLGRKIDAGISDRTAKVFVAGLLLVSGIMYILKNRFGIF